MVLAEHFPLALLTTPHSLITLVRFQANREEGAHISARRLEE